ncbi:lipoprotein [Streptomyces sp. NPDC051207]|uniref:lipoprotein n=1 Tax=Streptomyces sp. NPDC051207 TaxID=3154641 RepID=UPI003418AA09
MTGCSADGDGADAKPSAGASQAADAKPSAGASQAAGGAARVAESGGRVGGADSACELPVTFDVAADWEAEAVDATADGGDGADAELAQEIADALLHQGPVTAACEIDAKPAGHIGFLRVWTGEPGAGDARTVLEDFVAAEDGASGATYRTFTSGGLDGAEVTYRYMSKLLDETKKERALAVATPGGPVVLHLGGMDSEEHDAMLPAYELAKRTLRLP